jgi:hypothetical protein
MIWFRVKKNNQILLSNEWQLNTDPVLVRYMVPTAIYYTRKPDRKPEKRVFAR